MEQLVARWAHNPKVIGSNPIPATMYLATDINLSFFSVDNHSMQSGIGFEPEKAPAVKKTVVDCF